DGNRRVDADATRRTRKGRVGIAAIEDARRRAGGPILKVAALAPSNTGGQVGTDNCDVEGIRRRVRHSVRAAITDRSEKIAPGERNRDRVSVYQAVVGESNRSRTVGGADSRECIRGRLRVSVSIGL